MSSNADFLLPDGINPDGTKSEEMPTENTKTADPVVSNPRYKTEMCRNFKDRFCIYGDSCQFAHGKRELREVVRNNKYKTKPCQKYWNAGYCVYGPRCNFLHDEVSQHRKHHRNGGSFPPAVSD